MKIAVVTPWFGAGLQGGAERVAWQAAHGLALRGHRVEVLTTCCRSFADDWSRNHYAPSAETLNGLVVHRFAVGARDADRFNSVNQKLVTLAPSAIKRGVNPVSREEALTFVEASIRSDDLIAYLKREGASYDAVLFMPYLYGPILQGWKIVADRAFLQPCLHDEAYAYLPQVDEMMRGVRGLLFNSSGELEIAQRIYGPGIMAHATVVGSAIELQATAPAAERNRIHASFKADRFVLYLGRRADTKNVSFLVRSFRAFRKLFPDSRLQLKLAGPGTLDYGDRSCGIIDLGFVSEDQKRQLLLDTRLLVQPSKNESYSRTMMEAWLCGRPVAVHAECLATARAVEETGAGWTATTEDDWVRLFAFADAADDQILSTIGKKASAYVNRFASWEGVLQNYEAAFGARRAAVQAADGRAAIHQILDVVEYGDVLALQSIAMRRVLLEAGFDSSIFSKRIDPRMEHAASAGQVAAGACLIVHAHRSAEAALAFADFAQKKTLLVHGSHSTVLEKIRSVVPRYDAVFATAQSARQKLEQVGAVVHSFLPIADPARWNISPDTTLMNALQDGKTNILSVHGLDPKNGQRELLQTFAHYLSMDLNARLIMAGRFDFEDPYYQELLRLVHGTALSQHVLITGLVSEPALAALYATAHVYCTLSEREHLGTTLLDAMWFDVPIVAFGTASTSAVLENSGLALRDKDDHVQLAALLRVVATDTQTRSEVRISQRQRLRAFDREAIREQVLAMTALLDSKVATQHK